MPTYRLRGIDVDFPFEAYDCQLVYMEKVIKALQEKCNALLESPTGTGKTLCLLCATLAWRKSLGTFSTGMSVLSSQSSQGADSSSQSTSRKHPIIIYASRTHSQIRQVIKELKMTSYRPKMTVLGSREQLCIHDEVSLLKGRMQSNACRFLRRRPVKKQSEEQDEEQHKKRCKHYSCVSGYLRENPYIGDEPIDIEDLVNIGKTCGPCPYYVSRELHTVVDILFAPYNYLIDPTYRKSLNFVWQDSVLIFDEAHNLESLCADAASFDLPSWLLSTCITEAKNCISLARQRRDQSSDKTLQPDDFAILRALLLKLEARIAEVPILSKEFGFSKPGPYIYELLADLNITQGTVSQLVNTIEKASQLIQEDNQQTGKNNICRLESIMDILKTIFRGDSNAHAKFYRVHLQEVEANFADGFKGKVSRTLSWWCFNPGLAMKEFCEQKVGSIILTSGTLSPMDSFALELKIEFPIRLENPHVITQSQLWAGVVPAGPSGYCFNSSYRSRDSVEYKQELGNAIVNFARIVPDGLLVFFPSYYLLDQCIACWKNNSHATSTTIWERICKHKKPVVEPRQSSLFIFSIEDYMAKLKDTSTSGAIFFAVCRGKVSEGLDFADQAGRAVVITGLPFATRNDPKVRLKREYLDENTQSRSEINKSEVLTGEEWYSQQASRAVNQAVGRVIRHRHDYGAIIFCDERFAHLNRQSQVSKWIQPHLKCYSRFGDVVFTLTRFFREGGTHGPTKTMLVQNKNLDPVSKIKLEPVELKQINEVPLDDKLLVLDSSTSTRVTVSEPKTEQSLDKSNIMKFLSSTRLMDHQSVKSSSLLEVNREDRLGKVLPANRSSLSSYKDHSVKMNYSKEQCCSEKMLLSSGSKDTQYQSCRITDFPGNSMVDGKSSNELIAHCSAKKRKLTRTEHGLIQQNEVQYLSHGRNYKSDVLSSNFMEDEKSHISVSKSAQNAQVGGRQLHNDSETMRRTADFDIIDQKIQVHPCSSKPSGDEKTRGSNFLIQVKEKLSASEYTEFVNSMKALKSKAMKINEVLQSIARLFSSPERLSLLRRFKDFIPAKYHSIYEQYFERNY